MRYNQSPTANQDSALGRPRKRDTHLPPCVHFKHGAYWYVKGSWKRIGKTLNEALAAYAELIGGNAQGNMPDLIDRVLKAHKPHIADNTYDQYLTLAKDLKNVFAEFDPDQVKPAHIANIKRAGSDHPHMTNRKLSFLRVVFGMALEWGEIEYNPTIGIKHLPTKARDRLLTVDEYEAIYKQAGERLKCIMDLWRLTGQRVTDVLLISRRDITDEGIYFKQQKTGKKLVVEWTAELREAVDRAKALNQQVHALTLFQGRKGKPVDYNTVALQWRKACKAAGVQNAQRRDLRAVAATTAKRQGIDATALLGHSDKRTTAIYLRDKEVPVVVPPSFRQSSK